MLIDYIKSDLYRYTGQLTLKSFLRTYLLNVGFNYIFWWRIASSNGFFSKFAKFILIHKRKKHGIEIPCTVKIGYGFYIGHGGPVIINPTTIIGNNVNLSQYTTIGSNDNSAASIGDCVYIGPNVCVVENVKIGNMVTIGAGSVVTKDIPENATAAGNYAKVLNFKNPGRYINKRWMK